MAERIVVLDDISETVAQKLRALLPEGFELDHGTAQGDDHLAEIIAEADYAITGQVGVSRDVLQAAQRLKLVHKWGVGVDNIDVAAAREFGIKIARTTGSNAVAVAEFTIGLIVCALRHLAHGHHRLQQREWRNWGGSEPYTLHNKTVGLVGIGAIGALGVGYATMNELLQRSDVVSLHCPLTPETAGVIDRAALQAMKPTAALINVARGGVVAEDDLVWALEHHEIHSAAVDVYEIEPLPADSPLIGVANLTLTPHLAAMAADTFEPSVRRMYDNIALVSRGTRCSCACSACSDGGTITSTQ